MLLLQKISEDLYLQNELVSLMRDLDESIDLRKEDRSANSLYFTQDEMIFLRDILQDVYKQVTTKKELEVKNIKHGKFED